MKNTYTFSPSDVASCIKSFMRFGWQNTPAYPRKNLPTFCSSLILISIISSRLKPEKGPIFIIIEYFGFMSKDYNLREYSSILQDSGHILLLLISGIHGKRKKPPFGLAFKRIDVLQFSSIENFPCSYINMIVVNTDGTCPLRNRD
jgi:hypothetical protein